MLSRGLGVSIVDPFAASRWTSRLGGGQTWRHGTPKHLDPHLIVGNYATHKTEAVQAWVNKHPRLHLRFTPTSASWLDLVERFFAEITDKSIRRGVFRSVSELQQAIMDYLDAH